MTKEEALALIRKPALEAEWEHYERLERIADKLWTVSTFSGNPPSLMRRGDDEWVYWFSMAHTVAEMEDGAVRCAIMKIRARGEGASR